MTSRKHRAHPDAGPSGRSLAALARPDWPTMLRQAFTDGRMIGVNPHGEGIGSVWLYKSIPLSPVRDAKTRGELDAAASTLMQAFIGLQNLTTTTGNSRRLSEQNYRDYHLLLVNVPQLYRPHPSSALRSDLVTHFGHLFTHRRLLLMGVALNPTLIQHRRVGGRKPNLREKVQAAVNSVTELLMTGSSMLDDYDSDFARVDRVLSNAGMVSPTTSQVRLADSWWNSGQGGRVPFLPHPDHIHVFDSVSALKRADRVGLVDCQDWTPQQVPNTHALTMMTVTDFDLDRVTSHSARARWAINLLDSGALAVSIRGKVEPHQVTRAELRRQRDRYMQDWYRRASSGKLAQREHDLLLQQSERVEAVYAVNSIPTSHATSILVAMDGQGEDPEHMARRVSTTGAPLRAAVMEDRQVSALMESMLCSPVRSNPYPQELPCEVVAYAGLSALSQVGDPAVTESSSGFVASSALLGFTEDDRQPAYLSPIASSRADAPPVMLFAGSTGSGKTVVLQKVAWQFSRIPTVKGEMTPTIVINPKDGSDLSHFVTHPDVGGRVISLDEIVASDGVFDPLRFSPTPSAGVDMAVSLLMQVNPFDQRAGEYESWLIPAIRYGADRGADSIGWALELAREQQALGPQGNRVLDEILDVLRRMHAGSNVTKALIGFAREGQDRPRLSVDGGMTLIQVGKTPIELSPNPTSYNQRAGSALIRMMVHGSAMAVSGRDGAVLFDEGWVFMQGSGEEMERLGRVAREQRVMVALFTQRVSDLTATNMENYLSRALGLSLEEKEARAFLDLVRVEPTPELLSRLTAPKSAGFKSFQAQIDPATRKVRRGSVGLYMDLKHRVVPIEVDIPKELFKVISSSAEEKDARARQAAEVTPAAGGEPTPDKQPGPSRGQVPG